MKKYLPPLAVIFAALLWSLDGFLRQELSTLPAIGIVTLEHLIGALVLLPFLIRGTKEIRKLNQRGWVSVFWISIAGGLLGTFFYTKALSYVNYIDLSIVVLLQKFQPLFAIALAAVILKEPFSKRYLLLALMALVGGYFVTFGLEPVTNADDKTLIAALLALLAAFSWGSSTVLGKHALRRLSFPVVTALRQAITAIFALVILTSLYPAWTPTALTGRHWVFLLIIVFSTGSAALFIYYYGLNHLPASHATIYELFWPLSAVAMDYLVRGHALAPAQIFGGLVLLAAIVLLPKEQPNHA